MSDLEPDVPEVLQTEAPDQLTAVPVCVEEVRTPVRIQALPRKGGSTRTRTVDTTAERLLTADHRRASAVLMATDQNLLIAFSEAAAQDASSMSVWPKLVPFTVSATVEVWVAAATATTPVSITTERWAEG